MKVLLLIVALLVLLGCIPLGFRVLYDAQGLTGYVLFGLLRIRIYPKPPKKEKRRKKQAKSAKEKKPAAAPAEKKPLGAQIEFFLPFVHLALQALGELRRVFVIRSLRLLVTYGGQDAGQIAQNYGRAWAVLGAGRALLMQNFRVKRCDMQAELDFACRSLQIVGEAAVTVTLGRLLGYLLRYGGKAVLLYLQQTKKEKAVQKDESSDS